MASWSRETIPLLILDGCHSGRRRAEHVRRVLAAPGRVRRCCASHDALSPSLPPPSSPPTQTLCEPSSQPPPTCRGGGACTTCAHERIYESIYASMYIHPHEVVRRPLPKKTLTSYPLTPPPSRDLKIATHAHRLRSIGPGGSLTKRNVTKHLTDRRSLVRSCRNPLLLHVWAVCARGR